MVDAPPVRDGMRVLLIFQPMSVIEKHKQGPVIGGGIHPLFLFSRAPLVYFIIPSFSQAFFPCVPLLGSALPELQSSLSHYIRGVISGKGELANMWVRITLYPMPPHPTPTPQDRELRWSVLLFYPLALQISIHPGFVTKM